MMTKKQIFFLHFAGGSAYSYDFLKPFLKDYDVHQLELPGRGKRVTEPFVTDMKAAIQDYLKQIVSKLNGKPFLIYGHSMGAVIGAYITSELESMKRFPVRLIVSGNPGPGCLTYKQRHTLPRADFLQELRDMGGMPEDFFAHEGLIDYFVPILKSDFKVLEANDFPSFPPLSTSIIAMMGDEEEKVNLIDHWKTLTASDCEIHIMKGKHFFINDQPETISGMIKGCFK